MKTSDVTAKNRAAWDASALYHGTGTYWEDLATGFADPTYSVFDTTMTAALQGAGIKGARAVQVGCNNGREVLSACALGAQTCLGIDQSPAFLAQAAALKEISGHPATFLEADIYALPAATPRDHDLAFITIGVLNWMPDLATFMRATAALLRPGGRLVIYETHPMLEMFDPEGADPFALDSSYFNKEPYIEAEAIVYDDSAPGAAPESHWFAHTLSDIVQGALDAGLTLTELREYPHSIRETLYDQYQGQDAQVPMSFLMCAAKA